MTRSAPAPRDPADQVFRYTHVVSFQETNVVGNVYFTRHLEWQGRCRELFIHRYAPSVLDDLGGDLRLVTLRVACDYHAEVFAFDEIELEMRLIEQDRNRIRLGFVYWRMNASDGRAMIAEGTQDLAAMVQTGRGLAPCPLPEALTAALEGFLPQEVPQHA